MNVLVITHVANGWILQPGGVNTTQTHVATNKKELLEQVEAWAMENVTVRNEPDVTSEKLKKPPLFDMEGDREY